MLNESRVATRMKRCAVAVILAGTFLTSQLLAQPSSGKAAAEALFREGKRLMGEKKFSDACPKFADSQKLDPAAGTLLNLAFCYEANGQTATAWATYQDAAAAARTEQNTAYMSTAEKRGAAIEPKLSKMTVTIAQPVEGLEVHRDGVTVSKAEWGLEIPVDPGTHKIEVVAPKKKPWSLSVEVAGGAARVPVQVPALEDAPDPTTVTPQPSATTTPTTTTTATVPPTVVLPPDNPPQTQKIIGWISVGVGVVGLGVGTGFALKAKSQYNDSLGSGNVNCPVNPNQCNSTGVSLRDDARSSGNVASVLMAIGAVGVVGGAILVFTSPSAASPPKTGKVRLVPTLGGALLQGVW